LGRKLTAGRKSGKGRKKIKVRGERWAAKSLGKTLKHTVGGILERDQKTQKDPKREKENLRTEKSLIIAL